MSSIIKSIGTLCVVSYILGILFNLVNLNYTQKAIRLTAALYIICAVFVPIKNIDFDIEISEVAKENIKADSVEYVISVAGTEMENTIKALLDEKNISYTQVDVHIYEQSDGLSVDCIEIYGTQQNSRQLITQLLSEYGPIVYGE